MTIGAFVAMAIDALLLLGRREVPLVGILRRTTLGTVALTLAEQALRFAVVAVPQHLVKAFALDTFARHRAASVCDQLCMRALGFEGPEASHLTKKPVAQM